MAGAASGEPSWLELSRVATDKDIVNGWLPMSPAYGRPKRYPINSAKIRAIRGSVIPVYNFCPAAGH